MKVGDKVICIEAHPTRPHGTSLVDGQVYEVLGVRDINLQPPANPNKPEEIKVLPGPTRYDKMQGGWWFSADRFQLAEKVSTDEEEKPESDSGEEKEEPTPKKKSSPEGSEEIGDLRVTGVEIAVNPESDPRTNEEREETENVLRPAREEYDSRTLEAPSRDSDDEKDGR